MKKKSKPTRESVKLNNLRKARHHLSEAKRAVADSTFATYPADQLIIAVECLIDCLIDEMDNKR